jgi:hypothetical protein
MSKQQNKPKSEIPYLTIVSYFMENDKDTISFSEILTKFGDSLTDTTMQVMDDYTDSILQGEYEYRESKERKCILDVSFDQGKLLAFSSQIYFEGKTGETEIAKFLESELVPIMNKIIGEKNIKQDKSTSTYYCSDFNGWMVTFFKLTGKQGISTEIYRKTFN